MQPSILLTLLMMLLILCGAAAIALLIFGLIFRKKPLWITGIVLFCLMILTLLLMMAARELF
jgi:hypothetical protein